MDAPTQTDITVRNGNGEKTALTGVSTAAQTTYALSKSESTNSSIQAQLEVATSHDDETLNPNSRGPPQDGVPVSRAEAEDEPCVRSSERKTSLQIKKSVSVLDGNVIWRRSDNQQGKVADAAGKESERNKLGEIERAPTKIILNLKLDVGEVLTPEDLEIAVVARSSKVIKENSIIDKFELPKHEQNAERVSKVKDNLILMYETNMIVTPEQIQEQYVPTLLPLTDENTASVLDLVGNHIQDINIVELIESNLSMNVPKEHLSGNLMKLIPSENTFLWGIPALPADLVASIASAYSLKKGAARSHLDDVNGRSDTSMGADVASMKSLLNPTETRMILDIQKPAARSVLMSDRLPSRNQLALRLTLDSGETLTGDANKIKLVLHYDQTDDANDSAPREVNNVGPGSVGFEPDGDPVVISVPVGDDNVLITLTSKIAKKDGDKATTERPAADETPTDAGETLEKKVREAADVLVDSIIAQLSSAYTGRTSPPQMAARGSEDESGRQDGNVRTTRSSVTRAIAEGTAPLNAAFDDIRATLVNSPDLGSYSPVARPQTPDLEQTPVNCAPYNYVPHYAYDCGFVNYATRQPRYRPECHRYEPRRYDYPATSRDQRCPITEMHVTLSQQRNVTEHKDEARGTARGGKQATAGNTDARERGVFDNIEARCRSCGSEAVELRSKTQGSDNQQSPSNTDQ